MKIEIDIKNDEVVNQVVKALVDCAYEWELKRKYYEEKKDVWNGKMKERFVEHNIRREAECKNMSDEIWKIAERIREARREDN